MSIAVGGYVDYDDTIPIALADIPVVVFHLDGTVASVVRTDADGRATATVERGALVAVVNGDLLVGKGRYVNVDAAFASPGDALQFGPKAEPATGTLRVSWPSYVVPNYTTYYEVTTPCGSAVGLTTRSASFPITDSCASGPFSVAVTARRSSGSTSVAMSKSGIPAGTVNVVLDAPQWVGMVPTTISITNQPSDANSSFCALSQVFGSDSFYSDGDTFDGDACELYVFPAGGSSLAMELSWAHHPSANESHILQRASYAETMAVDAAMALPWGPELEYDRATRNVTTGAHDASIDAATLHIDANKSRWRIWSPKGFAAEFTIPSLPPELAEWDIDVNESAILQLWNIDVVGSTSSDGIPRDVEDLVPAADRAIRYLVSRAWISGPN